MYLTAALDSKKVASLEGMLQKTAYWELHIPRRIYGVSSNYTIADAIVEIARVSTANATSVNVSAVSKALGAAAVHFQGANVVLKPSKGLFGVFYINGY